MAAELITPIDEFSGLPLPLLPVEADLPIDNGQVANWHHHFHPSTDPALVSTSGGRALRTSRIQLVPATHHNYSQGAYHRFYAGPPIPTDRGEQFGMCVLACAGYVPDRAIDVSAGEPSETDMTPAQVDRLRIMPEPAPVAPIEIARFRAKRLPLASLDEAANVLKAKRGTQASLSYRNLRYGYDQVKEFFKEMVLAQDVSHLSPHARDRFLKDGEQTQGLSVLAQAAKQAVETTAYRGATVDEVYAHAYEAGRLHPRMPASAAQLVKNKLGDYPNRSKLLPDLRARLLGIYETEVAS